MQQLNASESLVPRLAWEGVTVRFVTGKRMTIAIAELRPGVVVPRHTHENEQLGTVIEGSARFTTDTESRLLYAGGVYRLLSDEPHEVEAGPDGAVLVECFAPHRSDWERLVRVPDGELRWPALSQRR